MKKRDGFIQIPIVAIIGLAIVVVGSISYVGLDKYKQSLNEKVEKDKVIDELADKISQLEQVSDEQGDNNQMVEKTITKETTKEIPAQKNPIKPKQDITKEITNGVVPTSNQDNNKCVGIRNEFDNFEQQHKEIYSKLREARSIYGETTSSSEGLSFLGSYKEKYSKSIANKDSFSQFLTETKDLISNLPVLTNEKNEIARNLKDNYLKASSKLLSAYNLNQEVYKNISEELLISTLESYSANLDKAFEYYKESINYTTMGNNNFNTIKKNYDNILKENKCDGFCDNGYFLANGECYPSLKKIISILPKTGTFKTIFSIKGENFTDMRKNNDIVLFGDKNAEIISWSNNEIQVRPKDIILESNYAIRLISSSPSQNISIGTVAITN